MWSQLTDVKMGVMQVAGPGGPGGGGNFGMATDGERVYTNIVNNKNLNFTLVPKGGVTLGGGWVGMNASTGQVNSIQVFSWAQKAKQEVLCYLSQKFLLKGRRS